MAQKKLKLSGLRGVIAQRMMMSLQSTAQYTLHARADVTNLIAERDTLPRDSRPSLNDVVVAVVAKTLAEFPYMNGTVSDAEITLEDQRNIGIAVATDRGLMVPVMHEVESKNLIEISAASKDLIQKAKAGKLSLKEFSGGTFTVSNLGSFGIDYFTPIVNAPEIAILGIGKAVETAVRKQESFEFHYMLPCSLTIDHRAVDGAPAGEFLNKFCENLGKASISALMEG